MSELRINDFKDYEGDNMEGSELRGPLKGSRVKGKKNLNQEDSYVVNINSEIYSNINNSGTTGPNTDSEPFDFSKVIEEEFANQENEDDSEFLVSVGHGQSGANRHRPEPGHGNSNYNGSGLGSGLGSGRNNSDSGMRMHHEMEYKLAHIYNENPLTIVSEERSIQYADVSNPSHSTSNPRGKNEYQVEFSKGKGYKYTTTNSNYGQESGNKGMLFGDMLTPGNTKTNRLAKSYNPEMRSPMLLKTEMSNGQMTRNGHRVNNDYRPLQRNISEEPALRLDSKEEGNMIVSNGRFRTASEDVSKNYVARFNFIPKDDSKTHSSIRIKDRPVNLHIEPHINSEFVKKRFLRLPICPLPQDYMVDILRFVSSDKQIRKKQSLIEDIFVKINYDLYYNGDIRFGKLSGRGIVLLRPVDHTKRNSPEFKKNLLFEGEFSGNKVNGKGVLYFQNSVRFEGNFSNGLAHGNGTLFGSGGQTLVSGIWLDGKYNN